VIVGEDGQPLHPCVTTVGAIPFCFRHVQDWQDGCDECAAARPVRDMLADHQAVHAGCTSWPLCSHAQTGRRTRRARPR